MRHRVTTLSAILIGSALAAPANADPVQCSQGNLVRSIEVVYEVPDQAVPCEVIYNKSQEGAGIHSLWRASNEAGYCESQASAFVDKLRAMGWDCIAAESAADADVDPGADPGADEAPAEIPIAPDAA